MSIDTHADGSDAPLQFLEQARTNQARLVAALQPHYDFVVCGAGSSGSVVARRLAENPDVSVLLVEAGGDDDVPSVTQPGKARTMGNQHRHRTRLGISEPTEFSCERPLDSVSMGKVLGGGSSINLDGLGPRTPQRLGPVRRRDRRSGVELRLRAGDLPPHRRMARRSRPRPSRHRWPGLRTPAPSPNPLAPCHGGGGVFGRHSDVREPERRNDGVGQWGGTHRPAHPRRPTRVGIPLLRLSPSRPA